MSEESQKPLSFKPLSPGLGFHPFSDGLPYAPITKTAQPTPSHGLGAVAAGPATFLAPARPQPYIPARPHRVTPNPVSEPKLNSEPTLSTSRVTQIATPPSTQADIEKEQSYGFVYLLKRSFAYTIDTTVNITLASAALCAALIRQGLQPESLVSPGVVLLTALFLIFFNWALIAAQEIAFGTSFGKRLFGLQIEGSLAAIFLRAFFFLPSAGFCGLGLLWAIFDGKRRCWHDVATDIQPREIATL